MTWYFNINYREGAFRSPLSPLLVTEARKRYDRSYFGNVLGQLGTYLHSVAMKTKNLQRRRWTNEVWTDKRRYLSIFRILQMIFDPSAIEQTHGFALFLSSWWMEAREIPAGLRQSVTSLVYNWYNFSPINAYILRILSYKVVNFLCKLRAKRRVYFADQVGMKNTSA